MNSKPTSSLEVYVSLIPLRFLGQSVVIWMGVSFTSEN